jgi:hypothetical protein
MVAISDRSAAIADIRWDDSRTVPPADANGAPVFGGPDAAQAVLPRSRRDTARGQSCRHSRTHAQARRFKSATGTSFFEYVQNLRIEEAKRLRESSVTNTDDISVAVGYEDHSFFRRLFKRLTGVTPAEYRRMFHPVIKAGMPA